MKKKEYLAPEFIEIEAEISDLMIGTGGNNPDPGEQGGDDAGAKAWSLPFNSDEPEEDF